VINKNYWASGEWNLICDSCGKKMKSSNAKHRWDGFVVCNNCFEHRHPQDFVKPKIDKIVVPFTRPRPDEVFVDITYTVNTLTCTPAGASGNADYGVADCLRADENSYHDFYYINPLEIGP